VKLSFARFHPLSYERRLPASGVKNKMFTKEGKRIAEERHRFMVEFFKRLDKEVEGKL